MNKLLTISLSILLFLLLSLAGLLFFAFSQTGNEMLKPYVQKKLEEEALRMARLNHLKTSVLKMKNA